VITLHRVDQLRDEAIALRLSGKSVREIRDTLGPVGKRTLSAALKGTPPAEWTHRPNAKDDLRDQARELRTQGLSYNEIVARLGVSKSSVSLWVRDIPGPERFAYVHNERRQEGLRKFNAARTARHAAETKAAAAGNPTLKRHNPETTRGNVGEAYHGCLRIEVRRSGDLTGGSRAGPVLRWQARRLAPRRFGR
jgi:hypothetical protein